MIAILVAVVSVGILILIHAHAQDQHWKPSTEYTVSFLTVLLWCLVVGLLEYILTLHPVIQ